MRRTFMVTVLALSLMMALAGVASAQEFDSPANDRASCVGILSSLVARGVTFTEGGQTITFNRADIARQLAEDHKAGGPTPGSQVSGLAKARGPLQNCFEATE